MNIWLTICSFIALYLSILGLAFVFGNADQRGWLGAFFTSLGLSFFLRLWVATRAGR